MRETVGMERASAHGGAQQDWLWSLRTGVVVTALLGNAVIAVQVLSIGALRLEYLRLDPGRALLLMGMLTFPALLAAASLRGPRPAMLTEAGVTSVLLTPLSMTGATGPMFIVGVLYLSARLGVRTRVFLPIGLLRAVIASGSLILAFISLLFLTEERCIHTEISSSCSDSAVTPLGTLAGLGALAFGLWASRTLSAPSGRARTLTS
jgi:hypothetical protein